MKIEVGFIFILMIAIGCCNDEKIPQIGEVNCIKVTYLEGLCNQYALRIETPQHYKLGEDWKEHSNVIYAEFECGDGINENSPEIKGNQFYVDIVTKIDTSNGCVTCLAKFIYDGNKKYVVRRGQKCV